MSGLEAFPEWAAVVVALLVLAGSFITLAGTIGLVRFRSFYERVHAPTLGTSFGAALLLIGSMLFFTVNGGRPVLHEILIFVFVTITTPVTLMLLARAALYRDRAEGNDGVPRPEAMARAPEDGVSAPAAGAGDRASADAAKR